GCALTLDSEHESRSSPPKVAWSRTVGRQAGGLHGARVLSPAGVAGGLLSFIIPSHAPMPVDGQGEPGPFLAHPMDQIYLPTQIEGFARRRGGLTRCSQCRV